ncbi:MAG TPA: penicillin-insensitive murein endopeptidase [Kofleriaceae bacterium]|nr:penicillin-insensitive murein endopeptidase [Kofleriaceae bacterium]
MRSRWVVFAMLAASAPARADRHVVERGETLEHVAKRYGCSVEAVLRANGLTTTLVRAGTSVRIPDCERSRAPRTRAGDSDVERARRALAVIDGAVVATDRVPHAPERAPVVEGPSRSIGEPWDGRLRGARQLPEREGYQLRRPQHAYGASYVIDHVQRAIAEVRALYPHVHALAIGDLSARDGGPLAQHRSHQSGVDVDIGFYFTELPAHYPAEFAPATDKLDLEATWALVVAFARTADRDDGVDVIFLDRSVQRRLYRWAKQRGTPDDQLSALLQYPRSDVVGLVRHWPNHDDHMHVRFKSAANASDR